MAVEIIKIDKEKDNLESRFRLVIVGENIDVVFSRKSFREVLESFDFSSKRIGSILRLLNKKYPVSLVGCRVPLDEKFSDMDLIAFLRFHGLRVRRKDCRIDLLQAIKIMEARGYDVQGSFQGLPYSSPVFGLN